MNQLWTGGPDEVFNKVGREQLIVLLNHGLLQSSRVLDFGCGCLRGGRWLIPLLDPGCYHGIEPDAAAVSRGLRDYIAEPIRQHKRPNFSFNDDFELDVFDTQMDFIMMRSIWTHADKDQIQKMLYGIATVLAPDGQAFASYLVARNRFEDYNGVGWWGRSHESDHAETVRHHTQKLYKLATHAELRLTPVAREPINGQRWLMITKAVE